MSKSVGNVISPDQIMDGSLLPPAKAKKKKNNPKGSASSAGATPQYDALGPDALRLWVAGSDYTRDIVIGQPVLATVTSMLQKFRVTIKLLLGGLQDFDPADQVRYEELTRIDQMGLLQLSTANHTTKEFYTRHDFAKGML